MDRPTYTGLPDIINDPECDHGVSLQQDIRDEMAKIITEEEFEALRKLRGKDA